MSDEPLPKNYDYSGVKRGLGYVRGITNLRCPECKATGLIDDLSRAIDGWDGAGNRLLVCPRCGGYGDVPGQIIPMLAGLTRAPVGQRLHRRLKPEES